MKDKSPLRQMFEGAVRAFAVVGVLALVAIGMGLVVPSGLVRESIGRGDANNETYRQLSLLGNVFQKIRNDYVEEVEAADLVAGAITGMLTDLDPHSDYVTGEDFLKMRERTSGTFAGLGMEVIMEDGFIKVISPIDDTPAARAGIMAGDYITRIEDTEVQGLGLNEAVELMRGPVGSEVTITIYRKGEEPFNLSLTRATIKKRSVRVKSYDDIGYIRIITFSEQTTPGLQKAIKDLRKKHGRDLAGIVLDLRNNPGGLLTEAIAVTDTFLDRGEIVSTRGRNPRDNARFYAQRGDATGGVPMVVLINAGSASASEVVAGALQDHQRAEILGTRSFGKGSVQSVIPLGTHGAMRLTTARYYTPSGVTIQGEGITPDILVEAVEGVAEDPSLVVREENLRGALKGDNADNDNRQGDNAGNTAAPEVQPDKKSLLRKNENRPAKTSANENKNKNKNGAEINTDKNTNADADAGDDDKIKDYQLARALDFLRGRTQSVTVSGRAAE